MFTDIRQQCQQLTDPRFDRPEDLVSWMGAVQAQDYDMAEWAVGIRLKEGTLTSVRQALREGKIIRTHIMRPTWHFVAAEDLRWMLQLTGKRVQAANESYGKSLQMGMDEKLYLQCNRLLEKLLEGHKSLTKQEIEAALNKTGIGTDSSRINRILMQAESEGLVCSGEMKGNKHTYALLEERVPPVPGLTSEEALARFAGKYFQSHSPASLQDFVWWSGLTIREARQAMELIRPRLLREVWDGNEYFIHESYGTGSGTRETFHLLPSFDEYLISYKDRSGVLAKEHYPKAFNRFGTFYPVILHNGNITGNWKKSTEKKQAGITLSFFRPEWKAGDEFTRTARERFLAFNGESSPSR